MSVLTTYDLTIPAAGDTTDAANCQEFAPVGIYIPTGFEGTSVTFLACDTEDGTFVEVTDENGSAITKTVAAATYVYLDPSEFAGIHFLKIVSDSTESAERAVKLIGRFV